MKGMSKGGGTRSGLLWEVERLLDECTELPQVLLMENVPQVHGAKNKKDFYAWINKLESLGYKNYYKDLNAKHYGIPQSRNRCFMVSLLGDYYYSFPKRKPLKLKLKDLLEKEVDEKYYLSDETVDKMDCSQFVKVERERERESRSQRPCEQAVDVQPTGTVGILLSNNGKTIEKPIDVAITLMARDCNGYSTYGTNGVLENAKDKKV